MRGVTYSSRNHIGLIFCSIPPSPSLGLAYRTHLIYTYMSVHPRGESCALHSPFEVPAALGGWATTEPGWTLLRAPTIPDILSRQASPSPGRPSRRGLALGKYPPISGIGKAWHTCSHQQAPPSGSWSGCHGVLTCLAGPGEGSRAHANRERRTGPRSSETGTATLREQTCFLTVSLCAIGAVHFS